MATYCTEQDAKDNIKGLEVGASNKITDSILLDLIAQESAVIDQHIRRRYVLEVTDATSLLFLKKICIDLIAYRVTKILQIKTAVNMPNGQTVQDITHSSAYREAMRMLKDIQKGKSTLPGEEERSTSFSSSTAVDCSHSTEIEYEEQQW